MMTSTMKQPTESTPLLERGQSGSSMSLKDSSVVLRVLLTGFLVSSSFGVTQIPLVYAFRVMECDKYYQTRPEALPAVSRCRNHVIEANTARSVALLGASTTFFGVFNLFFTSWAIRALGLKRALLLTIFFSGVRLFVQNTGVQIGGGLGIIVVQTSQIITLLGGPAGYTLLLSLFATAVVKPSERTGTLGRLSGCTMFGTAMGILAGGLLGDIDILVPFRVTFTGLILGCIYIAFALPSLSCSDTEKRPPVSLVGFFEPLKIFVPPRTVLHSGRVYREHGVFLLGLGTFMGVLATSYMPILLQIYSTDVFDFGTSENGWLISINSLVCGLFLTFVFPFIISAGQKWLDKSSIVKKATEADESSIANLPTISGQIVGVQGSTMNDRGLPEPPKLSDKAASFEFDLLFTKCSLLFDTVLTGLATFTTASWQMYFIAVFWPLASGTGPAAKGTILQLCPTSRHADALLAISLVELIARLMSTGVLGVVFAAFAEIGRPNLTFTINAAIAFVGFIVLMFVKLPSSGSTRHMKK